MAFTVTRAAALLNDSATALTMLAGRRLQSTVAPLAPANVVGMKLLLLLSSCPTFRFCRVIDAA